MKQISKQSVAGTEIKGHLFESKLATLFMVRAIEAGYQFEFTTNNEEIGGKFDDVILRYQVQNPNSNEGKHWRYRFVQAKHKVDKNALQIKASYLLSTSTKDEVTDYSLFKYFKSFCKIKARGDDIQDCIICTTIDFDYKNMEGIRLKPVDTGKEKLFQFENNYTIDDKIRPALYKLDLPEEKRKKFLDSCDIRILADKLSSCTVDNRSPTLELEVFNTYHFALVKENVIDIGTIPTMSKTMKFHQDFINNSVTLSTGAKDLRQMMQNLRPEICFKSKIQRPGSFGEEPTKKLPSKSEPTENMQNDAQFLAQELVKCITMKSQNKSPTFKERVFKTYHVALVKENVIDVSDKTKMKLHQDFINNRETLSTEAKDLRQMLLESELDLAAWKFDRPEYFGQELTGKLPNCITDCDVQDFLEKLIFVVNSPSEDELDGMIESGLCTYYNQHDIRSKELPRILVEVLNWFKSIKSEETQWLNTEIGRKILFDGVNQSSVDYRDRLMMELGFNESAISQMESLLLSRLKSSGSKLIHVSTPAPKWTANKIISAIENKEQDEKQISYWVMPFSCLQSEGERQRWKNRLERTLDYRHLLVIVCDGTESSDISCESLIPDNPMWMSKIIIISEKGDAIKDEIKFIDLDRKIQKKILTKTVLFQQEEIKVEHLLLEMSNDKNTDDILGDNTWSKLLTRYSIILRLWIC